MTGRPDHSHVEQPERELAVRTGLEELTDDELEVELTIAAYAPGRLRWERYQGLLVERLRRRVAAA
ncbi:MAG TPA: hypothetical protein VLJ76_00945 [Gaiellaceae bacterium]|nr:hypothetical protein [Gaiellaceae bacterium]